MWLACLTVTLLLIFISISAADIISPLTYSVLEEADPGDFRVVIPLDSGLSAMYGEDAVQMMTFAFSDDAAPHLDLFDLDNNGVLTTTSSTDRDVMCEHQPECTVDLSIRVQSDEVFHILQVVITVEDTNDNEPIFSDSVVSTSLSESSSPGSMFTIPAASDPDSPQYTIIRYQLVSGEADFSLVVNNDSPVWTQEVIYLSLLNHLDREQQDTFTIQVMAVDGSGQSDTLTVDILITDVNDNNPQFLSDSYSVTVDENLTSGSRIIQVEATDPDAGDNGAIQYQFSTKTQNDFGSVFSVDSSTGEVSLVGDLDHEIRDSYILTVTANNLSPGSLPDITQVEIKVTDLNDNAPDIRLVTNDQDGVVHLSETKAPGSFVAHVRVTDEDSGVNGQFECVLNHPVFELEKLFDTEFKIVTKKSLDREDEHMYDLWVYCKDKGESPQANSEYITVVIDDDNDNAPSFPKEKYETRVRENSDKLTLIQVKATDPDEGENGRVSLQLESNVGNILEIDEDTGMIYTKEPLDREQYSQLAFNVIARDHGQPAMTSSVQVVIIIEDEDDNDPTFALKAYTLNVNEHLPPYSEVGQVEAVDDDSEFYNKFTYDLRMSNEQENVFMISHSNGTIYTMAELDREERGSYNVVVVATSYNTNRPVTSNAVVTIIVGDVNDFKPVFKFPSPSNNTFAITSGHQAGQEILTLKAEDRDSGESGEITYAILSGNEEMYITLLADNGTLILNKDLDGLGDHLFALLLRIEDMGIPVRSSEATLNLLVRASGVPDDTDGLVSNRNLTVVIVIGCITGVIVVILLVTVVALLRRRHLQKHRKQNRRSMLNIIVEQKPANDDPGSGLSFTNESLPRRSSTQKMATSIERLYNGNHYQNHGVDNPECSTEGSHKDQHEDRSGQKSSQLVSPSPVTFF